MEVDSTLQGPDQGENVSSDNASEVTLVDTPTVDDGGDAEMGDTETNQDLTNGTRDQSNYVVVEKQEGVHESNVSGDAETNLRLKSDAEVNAREQPRDEVPVSGGDEGDEMRRPVTGHRDDLDAVMTDGVNTATMEDGDPPDRPPPVPPRPDAADKSLKRMDEVELGAQQDVTEVIGNVLFQLECAMRPTSIDANGEQLDEVKQ